jgi:hypothetical protein
MSNAPYALAPPFVPTVVTLPVVWPFQTARLSKFAKLPVPLPMVPVLAEPIPVVPDVTAVGAELLCVA